MSKVQVPSPPQASFEAKKSAPRPKRTMRAKGAAPLDEAFLQRVYRNSLLFGTLLNISVAIITQSAAATLSCTVGLMSGLLVLKAKELFVRRVVRPHDAPPYQGPGKWLPRWALGIGKFVLIGATIALLRRFDLINYVSFVVGCASVQVLLISMALGRLMANRDAGRSMREIYVTPHKIKNTPHV